MANENNLANNVTLNTNLNVAPYYDDFDESKNFHRILFRPGLAVQARELTQMQSIMQNQVDRFAANIFKEGAIIHGLDRHTDSMYHYVKVRDNNSSSTSVNVTDFLNKELVGATSGVRAIVVNTADGSEANSPDYKTLFVKYTSANTNGTRYFANNEILTDFGGSAVTCNTITSAMGGATGYGTALFFDSGVVYAKDHFIRVPSQTVILSKYSRDFSVLVGFDIVEDIVTEINDTTLLDPAQGSYNYAAPGAARLKLTANLQSISTSTTVSNTFVELMRYENGTLISTTNRTEYNKIKDYMAERTSDESGDYIVRGFSLNVKESLNDGTNQGLFSAAAGGDATKLIVELSPGKAYVKGYDVERVATSRRSIDKATDYASVESAKALSDYGNYVIVDNVLGNWDVNQQGIVSLRSDQANGVSTGLYSSTALPGSEIGTARVRGIQYYSGTPNLPSGQFKLYLTDIQMDSGYSFANVQSVGYNGGAGTVYGKADILGSNGSNASTLDTVFDRAIFRLPSIATKTLRNTSGVVNNDFAFYKSFSRTSSGATFTVDTADVTETFDGGGTTLSDAATRTDFYVVSRSSSNTSPLTGQVSITSGANTVTQGASAPNFTGQVSVGDWINIGAAGDFLVTQVNSTTLNVLQSAGSTVTDSAYFKKFYPGQVLDFTGKGGGGDRSIAISSTPATVATIDLNETLNGGELDATVVCHLNKIDGQEANKVIQRNCLVKINTSTHSAGTSGPWPLGLSDGFRLVSVRKLNGSDFTTTTDGEDVTSQFTLDTGARDSYYSHAQLVRKATTAAAASGDIFLVTIDYFTHTNRERGYFSVDSYPVDDSTAGSDTSKIYTYQIPVFVSPKSGIYYDLRDCVDFRPRMTDTANKVTTLTSISTNPATSSTFDTATGGLHFPPTNEDFTTDLDYYLSRIDIIGLSKYGEMQVTKGNPSLKPVSPAVSNDVMPMASIRIAPYPSLPLNVARSVNRPDQANRIRKFDNRGYTMRDIGKIASRIDRLEYYTTLNQLEKNAKDLLIPDEAGLNRFKNGIMTDNFSSHAIGNVSDQDYYFAIDSKKGEGRPRQQTKETPLVMDSSSTNVVRTNVTPAGISRDQRITINELVTVDGWAEGDVVTAGSATATVRTASANRLYVEGATANFTAGSTITASGGKSATITAVTPMTAGDLVTLPYSHVLYSRQPYATTTRNSVGTFYSYRGTMSLIPDSDYWCDTVNAPDLNVNLDLNTDAWTQLAATWPANWNAAITSFSGEPVLTGTTIENSGNEYSVVQPDGSQIIYQDVNTVSTYSTPTITNQTGTQNGIDVVSQTYSFGNVVVDTSIIPYMRSRDILFTAYGMKPSSRLYSFFDNIKVTDYITPLTKAEFDSRLKSGGSPISPAASEGDALYSDSNGIVYGRFRIPNEDALRFRTGGKRFRLVDNPTNSTTFGAYTTSAESTYTAEGLEQSVSNITVSTKSVEFTQTTLRNTSTGSVSSITTSPSGSNVVGFIPAPPLPEIGDDGNWEGASCGCGDDGDGDPIAQSLLISSILKTRANSSGMYLTKVDIFFRTKDSSLPVTIELREVDKLTGYITPKVIPFSRVVLQPADVNISEDASAATPVTFPSPVYLSNDTEVAIVIIPAACNPNYNVWTAVLGEIDIITGSVVSEQPTSGFMFTSANQRTWVPVENEDLKFNAYFAHFDKASTGNLILKNAKHDFAIISDSVGGTLNRVGEVVHGHTHLVGTFAPGNGLTGNVATSNSFVQGMTSGATGIIVSLSSSSVVVRDVSTNAKFTSGEAVRFRLGESATTSPITGNSSGGITSATTPVGRIAMYDNKNYQNNRIYIANSSYVSSGTASAEGKYFKTGTYLKGQSTGYQGIISSSSDGIYNIKADYLNLVTNMILPSNNFVRGFAKMATSTSTVDSNWFSINVNRGTELETSRYILSNAIESNTSASSSTMASTRSVNIKYELDGKNIVASPAIDLKRITLYSSYNEINSNTAIGSSEDNVSFGGDAQARYLTKIVTLADGQDAEDLRVYLSAYKPPGSDVFVYYKILNGEDNEAFSEKKWTLMSRNVSTGFTSASRYSSGQNRNDFLELVYDMPNYDAGIGAGKDASTGIVKYTATNGSVYNGFKYFALKIVLVTSNSANPPRVTDLRAIALQV